MGFFSKPKAPAKTAEEEAGAIRTRSLLDKEIEEEEERLRFARRGKLGSRSLLSGAPRSALEAASGSFRGGGGGVGSLLGRRDGSRVAAVEGASSQPRRSKN